MNIGISGIILNRNKRGFEFYLRQLVEHLARLDGEFHIFIYTDRPLDDFSGSDKVTVRVVPNRFRTFFWRNFSLPLEAFRDKIDIFHFPDNSVWLFPWKPTVVTLHDISPVLCRKQNITSRWMLVIIRLIYFFIVTNARLIVTDSKSSKRDIERYFGLPEGRVVAVPISCNPKFQSVNNNQNKDRLNDIKLGEKTVLFVGALDRRKNVVKVVQAVEIVRQRWKKDVRLIIVGQIKRIKGLRYTRRKEILYHRNIKDFVSLLGYVDLNKLIALYNVADVYVLPSHYEGFGMTVLEAQSCGTPVILSDSNWADEISGGNCLFIDPDNEVDIAEKILLMLKNSDLANELHRKGIDHAKTFSWHTTAENMLRIYTDIVKK